MALPLIFIHSFRKLHKKLLQSCAEHCRNTNHLQEKPHTTAEKPSQSLTKTPKKLTNDYWSKPNNSHLIMTAAQECAVPLLLLSSLLSNCLSTCCSCLLPLSFGWCWFSVWWVVAVFLGGVSLGKGVWFFWQVGYFKRKSGLSVTYLFTVNNPICT